MRGFPKIFCTKQDYLNVLANPETAEQAKERLRSLANDRFIWVNTGETFIPEPIPENATEEEKTEIEYLNDSRRAEFDNGITSRLVNTAKQGEPEVLSIFEKVEDENAEVFRLGFTLEEIDELTA